jgi:hypothetical protein
MVATVSRPKSARALWLFFGMGLVVLSFSDTAQAQSPAAFSTRPYIPPSPPQGQEDVGARYLPPPPVSMFRATPPVPPQRPYEGEPQPTRAPERPPYSIVAQAERDAIARAGAPEPVWNPASLEDVVAPPMVASGREISASAPSASAPALVRGARGQPRSRAAGGPSYSRRAWRRIFEDSRTGLVYDMPEALADALPWVDRDRKNEPFESVLARVADDLNRAALRDPEWALGAQREIRRLSKRLDLFPEPPPLPNAPALESEEQEQSGILDISVRPFRPRPIWPGASGRPESQVRPVTIFTETGNQTGPQTEGVQAPFVASAEEGAPGAAPRRRSSHGRAAPRRARGR